MKFNQPDLARKLERKFPINALAPNSNIGKTGLYLKEFLFDQVREIARVHVAALAQEDGESLTSVDKETLLINGKPFRIEIAESSAVLNLSIVKLIDGAIVRNNVVSSHDLTELSPWPHLSICTHQIYQRRLDHLTDLVSQTVNYIYQWFSTRAEEEINRTIEVAYLMLWQEIRQYVGAELAKYIQLFMIDKEHGVRVADKQSFIDIFRAVRTKSKIFKESPAVIARTYVKTIFDTDILVTAREVVPYNKIVTLDPLNLPMPADATTLLQSYHALYDNMTVQTLVGTEVGQLKEGATWLVATYDKRYGYEIGPKLEHVRPILRTIIRDQAFNLEKAMYRRLSVVDNHRSDAAPRIGEPGEQPDRFIIDAAPSSSADKVVPLSITNIGTEGRLSTDDTPNRKLAEVLKATVAVTMFLYVTGGATAAGLPDGHVRPLCNSDGGDVTASVNRKTWYGWCKATSQPKWPNLHKFLSYIFKTFPFVRDYADIALVRRPTDDENRIFSNGIVIAADRIDESPVKAHEQIPGDSVGREIESRLEQDNPTWVAYPKIWEYLNSIVVRKTKG